MTNREHIRKLLEDIRGRLLDLEYYCETEIVGEDTRHLASDIKGAQRQQVNLDADKLQEAWEIKPLYDRLKSISCSLRILRNNLDLSDRAVNEAIDALQAIGSEIEEQTDDEL